MQALIYNDECVGVQLPVAVALKVVQCDPGIKGASATARSKPATLGNWPDRPGAGVSFPGRSDQVDTRTGTYLSPAGVQRGEREGIGDWGLARGRRPAVARLLGERLGRRLRFSQGGASTNSPDASDLPRIPPLPCRRAATRQGQTLYTISDRCDRPLGGRRLLLGALCSSCGRTYFMAAEFKKSPVRASGHCLSARASSTPSLCCRGLRCADVCIAALSRFYGLFRPLLVAHAAVVRDRGSNLYCDLGESTPRPTGLSAARCNNSRKANAARRRSSDLPVGLGRGVCPSLGPRGRNPPQEQDYGTPRFHQSHRRRRRPLCRPACLRVRGSRRRGRRTGSGGADETRRCAPGRGMIYRPLGRTGERCRSSAWAGFTSELNRTSKRASASFAARSTTASPSWTTVGITTAAKRNPHGQGPPRRLSRRRSS